MQEYPAEMPGRFRKKKSRCDQSQRLFRIEVRRLVILRLRHLALTERGAWISVQELLRLPQARRSG